MKPQIYLLMLKLKQNMQLKLLRQVKIEYLLISSNFSTINMDQIGTVLLEKALIHLSAMKASIICFGMKDKQLFYFIKWVEFLYYLKIYIDFKLYNFKMFSDEKIIIL